MICEDIDYDIMRYLHTYIYLYKKDGQFKEEMGKSKGFCMKHFAALLEVAGQKLSGKNLSEFLSTAASPAKGKHRAPGGRGEMVSATNSTTETRISHGGESKDSLPRMITKLGGRLQR